MKVVLIICMVVYMTTYIIKRLLLKAYLKNSTISDSTVNTGHLFSVIQPIVSGDENLKMCLRQNIINHYGVNFVWIIDDGDNEASLITNELVRDYGPESETACDIRIVVAKDIPRNINEKVYKQNLGLQFARAYFIAADDDCIINIDGLNQIKDMIDRRNCVITGQPYYRNAKGFFSRLVVGFVNGNTLLTYPVIEALKVTYSLNGMFYVAKTSMFKDLDVYPRVEQKLSDEYEIAKVLLDHGVEIKQMFIPCSVGTTIYGLHHYVTLMKRWMVFVNIYMGEKLKITTFMTIALPTALPLIMVALASTINILWLLIVVLMLLSIHISNYYLRKRRLNTDEPLIMIVYELVSFIIQPLHFIGSLVRPRSVLWRKNRVTLNKDGSVNYRRYGE